MAIPSITELTLLKALWKQHPLSAREIHERVEEELAWSYSSTRKTLERMLEKGMISLHSVHGMNVYAPEKVETLAAFAHDFSHRVMEMNAPLPVNMFTGSKLVNQHELKELEQLLIEWPEDKE
jgi:BlaI family transcriptional regulator, penicillinase repressor